MEDVMLSNCIQYAVIEAVYSGHSERVVVAYATRKSLRALIAPSRILFSALESRGEAEEFAQSSGVYGSDSWAGVALRIRTKARHLTRVMNIIARQLFIP